MTGMVSRDLLGLLLALVGAASAGGLVLVGRRAPLAERTLPRPSVVGWRVAESLGWLFATLAVAAGVANLLS